MKESLKQLIANPKAIVLLFFGFAIAASVQSLLLGEKTYGIDSPSYNCYNNYTIFENSFHHLKDNQDLYILYPKEQWDLYKYTPTFSVFFGLFAIFPDWAGLAFWNLLNALVLLFAIYYLPRLSNHEKGLISIIVLIELMTSMQNEQSNALITGLIILAFGLLENKKYFFATFCIVCSVYIKLFGIVGFALFLFYPKKWKLALYAAASTTVLLLLPLIFVSFDQYMHLFQSYAQMLQNDHTMSYGYSVMGWLNAWFDLEMNKNAVVLIGIVIFLTPLLRIRQSKNLNFKYLALASILIWVVIFNHKAESPTFIIAMTGIAIWFIRGEKSKINIFLFVSAFILTSLSPTDIFPQYLRDEFVRPYILKALPCILIWIKIIYDMLTVNRAPKVLRVRVA